MAATPTPPPAPITPQLTPPPAKPTGGDVLAVRAFAVLFLLTLLIGLGNFIFSWIKYRQ